MISGIPMFVLGNIAGKSEFDVVWSENLCS